MPDEDKKVKKFNDVAKDAVMVRGNFFSYCKMKSWKKSYSSAFPASSICEVTPDEENVTNILFQQDSNGNTAVLRVKKPYKDVLYMVSNIGSGLKGRVVDVCDMTQTGEEYQAALKNKQTGVFAKIKEKCRF